MIGRNDLCWCGSGKKWKKCHWPKEDIASVYKKKHNIIIKNDEQIAGITRACKLAATILDETCKMAVEGISTEELNIFANKLHYDAGAIPAPLHYGYPPYPKSICTSINNIICHGIPDTTTLKDGDILNIDVTAILDGYYGDCSRMVSIGTPSKERQLVVDVSHECLRRSIDILKPGVLLSEIGDVISEYAESQNCSTVYQFVGHGVGIEFHEAPEVQHSRNKRHIPIVQGMIFTIEPMINAGLPEGIIDNKDQWTVRTCDGKPSGQWEHTILITEDGHKVLTAEPLRV